LIRVKESTTSHGEYDLVQTPKEAKMSELIVAIPVILFTVAMAVGLVAIMGRLLNARKDVPLEH
jgi:hypothetical protein